MDRVSDDVARVRWMAINVVRIAGVAMIVVGILGLRDALHYPNVAAWILVGVGLLDVFVVPRVLARKWRTPPG